MNERQVQVNFRMPESLKAKLEKAAAKSHRTTTAEIVDRLEASFNLPENAQGLAEAFALVEEMKQRLASQERAIMTDRKDLSDKLRDQFRAHFDKEHERQIQYIARLEKRLEKYQDREKELEDRFFKLNDIIKRVNEREEELGRVIKSLQALTKSISPDK